MFSLQGSVLKFDTRESIEPHLEQLNAVEQLEEVRFGGNTLGIDACAAVGDALSTKQALKVSVRFGPGACLTRALPRPHQLHLSRN